MIFFALPPRSAALILLGGALLVGRPPQAQAQTKAPLPATPPAAVAPAPFDPAVVARGPVAPAPSDPKADAEKAQKFLALFRMQRLCKTPLDLKVQDATLEQVAARVRQTLRAPAPPIEVRGALPMSLTFGLKGSTVGAALRSAGALAGTKLWVFTDHLLLVPDSALSDAERKAISDGTANQWAQSGAGNRFAFGNRDAQKVFSALVTEELKAGKNGVPAGGGKKEPSVKTTFGQLSPDAQEMLRDLVDQQNQNFGNNAGVPSSVNRDFTISSDTVVELNSLNLMGTKNEDDLLLSNGDNNTIGWTLSGNRAFRGWGSSTPSKPNVPPPAPPFLDPSAGKS